ncbi:MAG: MBL fold metallo-hydrolase [Oscillospiraceae bacterium]|nr:MBL fold metallo-hydrolase [Oscillospiraceae bacterium]
MVIDTLVLGLIQTNCYIVSKDGQGICAVIDPGSNAETISAHLRERELKPEYVFLTHGHFDHFSAVPELRDEYDFRLVIHELDASYLPDYRRSHYRGKRPVKEDMTVREGDVTSCGGLDFTWLHTPGHSLGSSVIKRGDVLFTGDTLFHGDCGRCDLYGGSYGEMLKSLKRLAELEGDYRVLPGHGPTSTLEREREMNDAMVEGMGLITLDKCNQD